MGDQSLDSVGQYRLIECRAEGHIARICKAVDRTNGQKVLIRIVDPVACRNPRIRAVLEDLRDPRSSRRIHDPHILRILDVGIRGESYYIVHEDFGGIPLDEYLQAGRPTLREALNLARTIAECLRAVHGHRLIHGDLKPQNILVAKDERGQPIVKVALADLAHDASDAMVSVYGELVGTPKYLSPEQIQGKAVTGSSDIFSLGIIFYELLSGREPFHAANAIGYLHANVFTDAPPLSAVDTALPADLSRIVARMLARDPRNRYRTIQALLDDLDRVEAQLDGIPPEAPPPGADSAFAQPAAATAGSEAIWKAVAVIALSATAVLLVATILTLLYARATRQTPSPLPALAPSPTIVQAPPPPVPTSTYESAAAEKDVADSTHKARTLLQGGKADEAIHLLQELLARQEGSELKKRVRDELGAALLAKGEALASAGKVQDALETFRIILRDYRGTDFAASAGTRAAEMLLGRAKYHDARGELDQALAVIETLATEFPNAPQTSEAMQLVPSLRLRLARVLLPTQPDKAVAILRELSFSRAPNSSEQAARNLLGTYLLDRAEEHIRNGRFAEALQDLREAVQLDSSLKPKAAAREPEALARGALDLKAKGKPAEAIAMWKQLAERYPANVWLARGQAEMAPLLEAAGGATAKHPTDPGILLALAEKELNANRPEAARPMLEQLVKNHPGTPQAAKAAQMLAAEDLNLAMGAIGSADVNRAQVILERIVANFPTTAAAAQAQKELARIRATPPDMVYVPGGEFTMGLDMDRIAAIVRQYRVPTQMASRWFGLQYPAHRVTLKPFYIDRNEVTNEQYRAFIEATGRTPPPSPDWDGRQIKAGASSKPVTHVTWSDAVAYAEWAGKRLPTEAEWEKAARGTDQRLFPWGNEFDARSCVTVLSNASGPELVGSLPEGRSPYGALDMIGNVQEWTHSALTPYPEANTEGLPFDANLKVARGAGWDEISSFFCITTMRYGYPPETRSRTLGFRCAKDAP